MGAVGDSDFHDGRFRQLHTRIVRHVPVAWPDRWNGQQWRAGVTPWPKPFQNLRSSRETELVNVFPLHVVTEWLGNAPSIAMKHYLTTTDDHFQRAIADSFSGATVGAVNGQVVQLSVLSASADGCPQLTQATTGSEVAPKSLIFPTILDVPQYLRQDSNDLKKSAEKPHWLDSVVQLSVRSTADLKELAADLRGRLTADDCHHLVNCLPTLRLTQLTNDVELAELAAAARAPRNRQAADRWYKGPGRFLNAKTPCHLT